MARKARRATSPEFRAAAHALLDEVLNENHAETLLIGWDGDGGVNAASLPGTLSNKTGLILSLMEKLSPPVAAGAVEE